MYMASELIFFNLSTRILARLEKSDEINVTVQHVETFAIALHVCLTKL